MADIVFANQEWTPQVQAVMAAASGLNDAYTVEDLRMEVERGGSALRAVVERGENGGFLLGYLCFWKEPQGRGFEMIVHAGAALTNEAKTFQRVWPHIDRLARENGCQSIRVHTGSAKRVSMFQRAGYQKTEIVLRKWV